MPSPRLTAPAGGRGESSPSGCPPPAWGRQVPSAQDRALLCRSVPGSLCLRACSPCAKRRGAGPGSGRALCQGFCPVSHTKGRLCVAGTKLSKHIKCCLIRACLFSKPGAQKRKGCAESQLIFKPGQFFISGLLELQVFGQCLC